MASTGTAEEKYEIITRRLQEVLGGDLIKSILAEGRSPKCYWGAFISLLFFYPTLTCHVQGRPRPEDVSSPNPYPLPGDPEPTIQHTSVISFR